VVADGFLERHVISVRQALRARSMFARKRLAQHFLLDAQLLRRIVHVAGDLRGREVIEIGPGPGGLTAALLEVDADVTALEIDPEWARATALALVGRGALELKVADALVAARRVVATIAQRTGHRPIVISNLPYAIASPLLVDLVSAPVPPSRLIVMVQREVAARITARAGESARGLLSLLIQLRATARRRFLVPAGAFVPPPKVESAVIDVVPDAARAERLKTRPQLDSLLRAAFQARRKTLRRGLSAICDEAALARVPAELLARRPEELPEEQWLALADALAAPTDACAPG
jgi:16S rRNA (adenine1518-N6/adenine1519-N6)-dimethyltransferase